MSWRSLLAAAGVCALVLAYWLHDPIRSEPADVQRDAQATRVTPQSRGVAAPRPSTATSAALPMAVPREVLEGTRYQALEMYRAWAKYPPNSRPLDEGQIDIIEPGVIDVGERPLFRMSSDGTPRLAKHQCAFQPLSHTATEGQDELIVLRCSAARDPRAMPTDTALAELDITSFEVTARSPSATWRLARDALSWNDAGTEGDELAGDRVYTFRVRHRTSDWGDMDVNVGFHVLEELGQGASDGKPYTLTATYFASPRAPAQFTGRFTERLERGSLVVDAGLQVKRAGRYRIYANLRQGDSYVGYAQEELELAEGEQRVPLLFFGKLFHEAQLHGTFTLSDLRGYRFNPPPENPSGEPARPQEPDREQIPTLASTYQTGTYRLDQFSAEEWQSPRKSERLQELQALAEASSRR